MLPDGTERTTRAEVDTAHIRGPQGAFGMLRLPELTPEEVPAGTEVWRIDEALPVAPGGRPDGR